MGFADSIKKVIGLEEIDEDDIVTEEELRAETKWGNRSQKKEKEKEQERDFTPPYKSTAANTAASRTPAYGSTTVGTSTTTASEKRASLARSGSLKLILIEPKSIDECPKLVDSLKARKPVIINLEKLETDSARKIFDFLSGATYALDGNVQKIANNIFIFTPDNVSVAAQQTQGAILEAAEQNRWR